MLLLVSILLPKIKLDIRDIYNTIISNWKERPEKFLKYREDMTSTLNYCDFKVYFEGKMWLSKNWNFTQKRLKKRV